MGCCLLLLGLTGGPTCGSFHLFAACVCVNSCKALHWSSDSVLALMSPLAGSHGLPRDYGTARRYLQEAVASGQAMGGGGARQWSGLGDAYFYLGAFRAAFVMGCAQVVVMH